MHYWIRLVSICIFNCFPKFYNVFVVLSMGTLDVAIRQTCLKLQEAGKKKSTSDRKDYENIIIYCQKLSLEHPQLLLWKENLAQSTRNFHQKNTTRKSTTM